MDANARREEVGTIMANIPNEGHRVPKPIPIEETVYSYLIILYGEEDVEKFPLEYPEDRMSLRILGKNVLLLLSAHSADDSLALLIQGVNWKNWVDLV
jgi:hypothetical protein